MNLFNESSKTSKYNSQKIVSIKDLESIIEMRKNPQKIEQILENKENFNKYFKKNQHNISKSPSKVNK